MFIRITLTSILTLILLIASNSLWLGFDKTEISFKLQSEESENNKILLTYNSKNGREYVPATVNEELSTEDSLVYFAGFRRIANVRMKFYEAPGSYSLENYILHGAWNVEFDDISKFVTHNIENLRQEGNKILFDALDSSAYIEIHLSPRAFHQFKVHYLLLISFATIYFILSYIAIVTLSKYKQNSSIQNSSLVFLLLFFAILFVPMIKINEDVNVLNENRKLAEYKNLFDENNQINNSFGANFESWFNDRFFLREHVIRAYNDFINIVNRSQENHRVLPGSENWLFLKYDSNIMIYQNQFPYSEEELINIASYLTDINNWAKENGKEFYFAIPPNKNRIYSEYFPKKFQVIDNKSVDRTVQLVNYLEKNTDVQVLYLYDALIGNKDKGILYYKNDTHWNLLGGYYGYQGIMEKFFSEYNALEYIGTSVSTMEVGDLTRMNTNIPPLSIEYTVPLFENSLEVVEIASEEAGATTKDRMYINENPIIDKNIFVLHDSFFENIQQPLSLTFKNSFYVWRYQLEEEDLDFILENYDIIYLQVLERFLPSSLELKFPEVK